MDRLWQGPTIESRLTPTIVGYVQAPTRIAFGQCYLQWSENRVINLKSNGESKPSKELPPCRLLGTAGLMMCVLMIPVTAWCEDLSSATDPLRPGTFTTSQHSDEWKIRNASAAAPSYISEDATIVDWSNPKETGHLVMGRTLRKGSNGWTCMPDVPGRPQHDPMCVDETMMKFLMSTGVGKRPQIDRVGLSYMLIGEAREGQGVSPSKDPSQVKQWFYTGPHIMIVLPDEVEKSALRDINQDLTTNMPYTTILNKQAGLSLWIIPVARSGERIHPDKPLPKR